MWINCLSLYEAYRWFNTLKQILFNIRGWIHQTTGLLFSFPFSNFQVNHSLCDLKACISKRRVSTIMNLFQWWFRLLRSLQNQIFDLHWVPYSNQWIDFKKKKKVYWGAFELKLIPPKKRPRIRTNAIFRQLLQLISSFETQNKTPQKTLLHKSTQPHLKSINSPSVLLHIQVTEDLMV